MTSTFDAIDLLPAFSVDDIYFESAALVPTVPPKQPQPKEHYDLISFLSITQSTRTDFLPITWHSALQSLGEGGEAEVNQSLVDLQTNFAFKRIKDKNAPEKGFRALISALLILQNAQIRRHPNVAKLMGVCWEVDQQSGNIWPVLVSEKAPLGDLRQFLDSEQGILLSVEDRIQLCVGVMSGIQALHASDIIHGDIKPENILVFPDSDGQPVAQVADFGYSCLGATKTDLVILPDPGIWAAPEWHDRPMSLAHAMKADIYSLGLVFVFIFFCGSTVGSANSDVDDPHGQLLQILQIGTSDSTRARIWPWKKEERILPAVEAAVSRLLSLDQAKRASLRDFFDGVLAFKTDARRLESRKLLSLTSQCDTQVSPTQVEFDVHLDHILAGKLSRSFKMSRSMLQLAFSECSIRGQIVENFERAASNNTCELCATDCAPAAAFQLAFCYATGFGIGRDEKTASEWLQRSLRIEVDLAQEIEMAKQDLSEGFWQEGRFKELWGIGHVRTMSFAQAYRQRGILEEALNSHAREVGDVGAIFGDAHPVSLALKSILSSILREEKRWREAEKIERHILERRVLHFEKDNPETLTSMKNMVSIYRGLGRLEDAKIMSQTLIAAMTQTLGAEHYGVLAVKGNLASTLLDLGHWKEAEQLYLEIIEKEKEASGEQHVDAIITLANLAMTYRKQGRLQAAEEAATTAAKLFEKLFDEMHPYTLTAKNNLALIYKEQGKLAEAQTLGLRVSNMRKSLLGPRHPQSLLSLSLLASIDHTLGRFADAEKAFAELLAAQTDDLGETNPETINTMSALATDISAQGRFDEAEALESRVVELSKSSLGEMHPDTLERVANLASTYKEQERWAEAEALEVTTLASLREVIGNNHPTTLIVMGNLALTLKEIGKLRDAEQLARKALDGMIRVRGETHPSTQIRMIALAGILESQGKSHEADELRNKIVAIKKAGGGAVSVSIIGTGQRLEY
ncbi:hypothetical protein LTS15_006369 [Exophiala xenobiotica]|nr:hypothetical protein LTS15_006369 [Exophiala xenobiotica]